MARCTLARLLVTGALLAFAASTASAQAVEKLLEKLEKTEKSGNVSDRKDRSYAIRKLGGIKTLASTRILVACLGDPLAQMRREAVKALVKLSDSLNRQPCLEHLVAKGLFDRRDENRRAGAAEALGRIGDPWAGKALVRSFKTDRSVPVRARAAEALGLLEAADAAKALKRSLHKSDDAAAQAALALGRMGAADAEDALRKAATSNRHWRVRALAIDALARLQAGCLPAVVKARLSKDKDFRPRIAAAEALAAVYAMKGSGAGRSAALELLAKALEDKAWQVRVAGVEAAVEMWDKACVAMLVAMLEEAEGSRLIVDVAKALALYVGKDLGFFPESWKGWWETNKGSYELPEKPKKNDWGVRVLNRGAGKVGDKNPTVSTFFSMPIFSKSFAFLFDLSGSMDFGSLGKDKGVPKIEIARDQFALAVRSLPKKALFNVYIYREEQKWPVKIWMESFQKDLVYASPGNRNLAERWVRAAEVKGRGPFYDGLVAVSENDKVDTIFLLADGAPSSGTYVWKYDFVEAWVKENRFRKVMICPVLVGSSGINVDLMKWLAEVTGGFYVHHKGK